MPGTKALPATIFDHMVWFIETGDGSWRRAEILLGECLVLFTSLDALHAFIEACDDREKAMMHAGVFSRNRKEFGRRARQAVKSGIIGALIDPTPESGEAPFLRFKR